MQQKTASWREAQAPLERFVRVRARIWILTVSRRANLIFEIFNVLKFEIYDFQGTQIKISSISKCEN